MRIHLLSWILICLIGFLHWCDPCVQYVAVWIVFKKMAVGFTVFDCWLFLFGIGIDSYAPVDDSLPRPMKKGGLDRIHTNLFQKNICTYRLVLSVCEEEKLVALTTTKYMMLLTLSTEHITFLGSICTKNDKSFSSKFESSQQIYTWVVDQGI